MEIWAIFGGFACLFAFGLVMYRAGKKSAENENNRANLKTYEKVGQVIKNNNGLGRAVLLSKLRDLSKNK